MNVRLPKMAKKKSTLPQTTTLMIVITVLWLYVDMRCTELALAWMVGQHIWAKLPIYVAFTMHK